MTHYRQTLREAVVTLVTGLPTTGVNVFSGRGKPIPSSRLPALRVRPVAEASQRHSGGKTSGDNPLMRTLELGITATAAGTEYDDTLDEVAAEVEAAIGGDPTLGGLVLDCVLSRSEFDEYPDGDKASGSVTLVYRLLYRTKINAPDAAV